MATVSERVRRMKKGFMSLHEEGRSIPEIAEVFHLSRVTVYHHLDEIAKENGTTREELLKQVHKTHTFWKREQNRVHIDVEKLNRDFDNAERTLQEILDQIDTITSNMEVEQ